MKYQILKSEYALVILFVFSSFWIGCTPALTNLAWSENEGFWAPVAMNAIIVEGLGISDSVYVLDEPNLTCITKTIKNTSLVDLSEEQPYKTSIIVQPYAMQFVDGQVSFGPNGDPIYDESFSGLPVASGDTVQFSACPDLHLECGFYKVTMTVDPDEILNETSKLDNVFSDFINVPGSKRVDLALSNPDSILVVRPSGSSSYQPIPEDSVPIQAFTLTSEGPLGNYHAMWSVTGATASVVTLEPNGSRATTKMYTLTPPAETDSVSIPMFLSVVTGVDADADIMCTVTLISEDGCVIKKQEASISIR